VTLSGLTWLPKTLRDLVSSSALSDFLFYPSAPRRVSHGTEKRSRLTSFRHEKFPLRGVLDNSLLLFHYRLLTFFLFSLRIDKHHPRGHGNWIQFWIIPEGQSITMSLEISEIKPRPANPATNATPQVVLVRNR